MKGLVLLRDEKIGRGCPFPEWKAPVLKNSGEAAVLRDLLDEDVNEERGWREVLAGKVRERDPAVT